MQLISTGDVRLKFINEKLELKELIIFSRNHICRCTLYKYVYAIMQSQNIG